MLGEIASCALPLHHVKAFPVDTCRTALAQQRGCCLGPLHTNAFVTLTIQEPRPLPDSELRSWDLSLRAYLEWQIIVVCQVRVHNELWAV